MARQKVNRESLILASLKVFRSKGYYHTSVAELAQACNIEKPHFYYYFKDKETLMLEVLRYSFAYAKTNITDKAYNEDYTPQQRIRKMMENARRLHIEDFAGCIMGNTILETSGHEKTFETLLQQYIESWQQALQHLLVKKHKLHEAEQMARELVNELQGSLMLMRLYRDPYHFYKTTEKIESVVA